MALAIPKIIKFRSDPYPDPESFVRGGPTLMIFFLRGARLQNPHKRAIIGPGPGQLVKRNFVEYDIWSNKTTGKDHLYRKAVFVRISDEYAANILHCSQ